MKTDALALMVAASFPASPESSGGRKDIADSGNSSIKKTTLY